jgi:hypothetical protein
MLMLGNDIGEENIAPGVSGFGALGPGCSREVLFTAVVKNLNH